ncbi:bifunctional methylenetetrahydrofolate dehydrogenase/methenyltetrahydrofolate cyclohydrolase FolD [soil metagenome]
MQILDGKALSIIIKERIKEEVETITAAGGKVPHLAAVLVGNDGGSETYVGHKVKACEYVGFNSTLVRRDGNTTEAELLEIVNSLNQNPDIDGFIVQLPLPKHINGEKVLQAIDPKKDVDGFHPINVGRMMQGLDAYLPATPYGILQLLEHYHIETTGKHCVVIGRSNIVGSPMSVLLARNAYPGNCTVTLCHSRTHNLREFTINADIIIAAIGKPGFLKADMVKDGAVVIDVGTTRVDDDTKKAGWRLSGDVDYENVAPKCSYITPVPGGVGPLTVTSLLMNTLRAAKGEVY